MVFWKSKVVGPMDGVGLAFRTIPGTLDADANTSQMTLELKPLVEALESILATAKEHPAFAQDRFDDRDMDALENEGGDVADWTQIAITAADALKTLEVK